MSNIDLALNIVLPVFSLAAVFVLISGKIKKSIKISIWITQLILCVIYYWSKQ